MRIRIFLGLLIAVLALLGLGIAAAPAAPGQVSLHGCETFSGKVLTTNPGATAQWTCNTKAEQGRVHLRCALPAGGYVNVDGGWVIVVGVTDTAYCPGSTPQLLGAAWQERLYAGAPLSTHWFYGPFAR